ncbi:hypothetical protein F4777DRAFT_569995 [Nemania sp. FL0916]|nr:hypothetical protein F4777DRAFT_569995 [Nemania sp. FL0916]
MSVSVWENSQAVGYANTWCFVVLGLLSNDWMSAFPVGSGKKPRNLIFGTSITCRKNDIILPAMHGSTPTGGSILGIIVDVRLHYFPYLGQQ